jgi:AraC family transcriptional regulator
VLPFLPSGRPKNVESSALTPSVVHHRAHYPDLVVSEFFQPSLLIPQHFHSSAVLSVVLDGSVSEQVGTAHFELRAHSIAFKPAGEPHTHKYGRTGARIVAVEVASRLAMQWMQSHAERVEASSSLLRHPALSRLRRELRAPDDLSEWAVQGAVLELITTLIRSRRQTSSHIEIARRAREYVHNTLPSCLHLPGLAPLLGVSVRQLDSSFRAAYGCSVAEYARANRFDRAVNLIVSSELSLAAIAHEMGYCDQAHMSRHIRQGAGVTPLELRRRALQKHTKSHFHPRQSLTMVRE